ncbi:MAG: PDZ domain-containing protein [Armatimonadetes bacterium]|nr:PDZ domain-containing protein [Armatimonadota bacterium]MBS1728172.1 PDZ domain-containing protein [Armatimonadota bacterium]
MLLLAASLVLAGAQSGVKSLPPSESALWARLRPSLAVISQNGQALGPAVFISQDGYAVANSLVVQRGAEDIITSNGLTYKFKVEANDGASQLCLVKTTTLPAGITTVSPADASDGVSGPIIAVMPSGVLRAELTGGEKIGVDQQTKRTFPISEVRVEQSALQMGGALLFSQNGHLIGALFAALAQGNAQKDGPSAQGQVYQNNSRGQQFPVTNQAANRNVLGPQSMVVAYTPTWEVTSKAISGFLSPEKKPHYGVLGVFVVDSKTTGVEITSVQKGTGADAAGLQVGDVIIGIDGTPIRNQIDFSRAIYRLQPGSVVIVSIQRQGLTQTKTVTVGAQLAEEVLRQQSAIGSSDSPDIH